MKTVPIKLEDNSAKVIELMIKASEKALEAIGMQAESYAKKLAPVGTPESTGIPGYSGGLLRNSITHAVSGNSPGIMLYTSNDGKRKGTYDGAAPQEENKAVYIGSNVEYATYVELGTSKMKAQPYIKPAVADHADEYKQIAKTVMENG